MLLTLTGGLPLRWQEGDQRDARGAGGIGGAEAGRGKGHRRGLDSYQEYGPSIAIVSET